MRRFLARKDGNIAVTFALTIMPVLGAAGMAVDYSRAVNVRSFVQSQADMTAFRAAQLGPEGDASKILEYVQFVTAQRYGDSLVEAMTVEGKWVSPVDYRVWVNGEVPVSILGAVPGFPEKVPFAVSSTVRMGEPRYVYKDPEVSELDYEAGDYNRIYVYCFNPDKKDDPVTNGRTQMTAIADNHPSTSYKYVMPRCNAGEALSFKLLNVRHVRTQPHLWDTSTPRFEYYTDTVLDQKGVEKHDMSCTGHEVCNKPPKGGWSILETVLCDTKAQCNPDSKHSIIPTGKNRTPQQAKLACSPGKYMYYGWEDRPPGLEKDYGNADWTQLGWTDKDYDDIRIVIACPSLEKVEDRVVRLID